MTNEIVTSDHKPAPPLSAGALASLKDEVLQLEICSKLAESLCKTSLVPEAYHNKPQDGAVAILWGRHLGLSSTAALQNIAVIKGIPTLWGDALVAIVKSSKECKYIVTEYDAENFIATVKTKRNNEPEESRSFSWEDASRAGLAQRDTYQKHPRRMLQARARSHLLRDVYPHLLKGFQVREIIEEDNEMYGINTIDATPIPNTDSNTLRELTASDEQSLDIEDYIIGAKTKEDFENARAMIVELPDGIEKERLKTVWTMNMEEVADATRS